MDTTEQMTEQTQTENPSLIQVADYLKDAGVEVCVGITNNTYISYCDYDADDEDADNCDD